MTELFCLASVFGLAILMSAGADLPVPEARVTERAPSLPGPQTSLADQPVTTTECGGAEIVFAEEQPPVIETRASQPILL